VEHITGRIAENKPVMSIGDLAFIAYVKKIAPGHPQKRLENMYLIDCDVCKSKMPASTLCGVCDTCLEILYRDDEI
jgi:hypothetical protein